MSAIVVITLGLGLGANAAVFSMIDALVLRPFTMRDVDRITLLSYTRPESQNRREAVSPADYLDLKKQSDVFERLAAFEWWTANLVGKDEPENVQGFFVSADFFPALGVQPVHGPRLPRRRGDDGTTSPRRARARTVAAAIRVGSRRSSAVRSTWTDSSTRSSASRRQASTFRWARRSGRRSRSMPRRRSTAGHSTSPRSARLAPGRTLEDAKAQMATIGERLAREHPDTNRGREVRVYTLGDGMMDIGLGPILSMW